MFSNLRTWWKAVRLHASACDNDDAMVWRYGATCEEDYEVRLRQGLVTDGHDHPMPAWLALQGHFENLVYACAVHLRDMLGRLLCAVHGSHLAVEVDESYTSPENPCVDWHCRCCGTGGRNWW